MKNNGNRLLPADSSMKTLVDSINDYNDYLYKCDNIKDPEERLKQINQGEEDAIKRLEEKLNKIPSIKVNTKDQDEIDEMNKNIFGVNTTNNGNVQQNANVVDENKEQNDDEKKIKNMSIDELTNYINENATKEGDKRKKKRKRNKNKKNNEQKNENNIEIQEDKKEEVFKNVIKMENQEEEKDDVFEEFKQDVVNNSINRYKIHKLKLKCNPNKLYNLIKNAEEKDNNVKK